MAEEILDIEPDQLGERDCRTLKQDRQLKREYESKWGSTGACRIR